jgi:sigma-B regulation protein RsbU (phosphoserine phosphatase)
MSESTEAPQPSPLFETFEDLYENAPCGYLSMQADGRIVRVNATFAAWIGFESTHLVGKRLQDLLTVGTRILYETSFAPLLSLEGHYDEVSLDLRKVNGEKLAVLASGKVNLDIDGQPRLTRVTFLKASERRRYEHQLIEARTQSEARVDVAHAASELREQFIAVLGHDLRNPLTSIAMGVRLLQTEQPADRRHRIHELMRGSVMRMQVLIDNVLDFARGRLGAGIPLEFRPDVLLAPVLNQFVAELQLGFPERAIDTDFVLPVPIKCDPSRIAQLASNLLGNALTHGSPLEPVRIHADDVGDTLTLWVANAGSPIPAVAMERLFEPFSEAKCGPASRVLDSGSISRPKSQKPMVDC